MPVAVDAHRPAGSQPPGGVVDHGDQEDPFAAALQPVVDGGVDLDPLAEAGASRLTTAMDFASALALPQAVGEKQAAHALGLDEQVFLCQLLAGEGGAEIGVAHAVGVEKLPVEVGGGG